MGSAVLTLRLGGELGSFPRALCAEEEKRYIELWSTGDMAARNKLIEHNLRLVAHIIKKSYSKSIIVLFRRNKTTFLVLGIFLLYNIGKRTR